MFYILLYFFFYLNEIKTKNYCMRVCMTALAVRNLVHKILLFGGSSTEKKKKKHKKYKITQQNNTQQYNKIFSSQPVLHIYI